MVARRRNAPAAGQGRIYLIAGIAVLVGLGGGLLIARHTTHAPKPPAVAAPPARPAVHAPPPLPKAPKPHGPAPGLPAATQFDFYTILPETHGNTGGLRRFARPPTPAHAAAAKAPAGQPSAPAHVIAGAFVLQAASFPDVADANRLRAELALRGLESYIEKVSISGRGTFYRVRLGPLAEGAVPHAQGILTRLGLRPILLREARGN